MVKQAFRGNVAGGVVGGVVGGLAAPPSAAAVPSRGAVAIRSEADRELRPMEPEARGEGASALDTKLHVSLAKMLECAGQSPSGPAAARCGVGPDGRVAIQVALTVVPDAALLDRLARAGFTPEPPAGSRARRPKILAGHIALRDLPALAAVPEVTLIATQG
jgi:hypothetical protein